MKLENLEKVNASANRKKHFEHDLQEHPEDCADEEMGEWTWATARV